MTRGLASQPNDHYRTIWDPLRGAGPSSAEHCHEPLEKKPANFPSKPGWKSLRPASTIQQDQERKQVESIRAERQELRHTAAREASLQRHLTHGFNPITGQEYNKASASWQPASDAWAHQKLSMRPKHVIDAGHTQGQERAHARQEALAPVVQMRKERIANGGLSSNQRRQGGVAELMQWGS